MNGAESLVQTLLINDVDVCFTNPGTSEMHFVAALDSIPGMRCVLKLFEGGATGAADGYYRMSGKPASTLLHLAPGLANGLANLHNAKKANSGIVNIVGEHATYHIEYDAPLTADIKGVATPMSHWVKTSLHSTDVAADGAEAVAIAKRLPGEISTLILPANTAWGEGGKVVTLPSPPTDIPLNEDAIMSAAQFLRNGKTTTLLLGGAALRGKSLELAGRIATKCGGKLLAESSNSVLERGAGRIQIDRIPYVVDQALAVLKDTEQMLFIDSRSPVAFFAYPNKPSLLLPDGVDTMTLTQADDPVEATLEALAEALGAMDAINKPSTLIAASQKPDLPTDGTITKNSIASLLGNYLPENAIVVDEAVTTGREFFPFTTGAAPHDWLQNRGGSIGFGLPVAVGAAIACPDRKVIALEGDGSAMYTVQSLWTMARENLDITILIFANGTYNILRGELTNVGVQNPGPRAIDMLSINRPDLNWVKMAEGMGVEAQRVTTNSQLASALKTGLGMNGPFLIEVVI